MRSLLLTAAIGLAVTLMSATTAHATFFHHHHDGEVPLTSATLDLDARSADPVSTPRPLAKRRNYLVTVSGVVSFFKQRLWNLEVPNTVICGTPRPITDPSPDGEGPGVGNVDAETVFASVLFFGCGNWGSGTSKQFELTFSVDDGESWVNPEPLGGVVKEPSADSTYYYLVKGAADEQLPLSFRLLDTNRADNNGRFTIKVAKADDSVCDWGRWRRFGVFDSWWECERTIDRY